MRVVFDTNIYLSGLIFAKSFPGKLIKIARKGKLEVYCSRFIIEEIRKNLIVKFRYNSNQAEKFIEEIIKFVRISKTKTKVSIIKEKEDDNRILECALDAHANYLISGDKKHILPLKQIKNIKIITAKEFYEIFTK